MIKQVNVDEAEGSYAVGKRPALRAIAHEEEARREGPGDARDDGRPRLDEDVEALHRDEAGQGPDDEVRGGEPEGRPRVRRLPPSAE